MIAPGVGVRSGTAAPAIHRLPTMKSSKPSTDDGDGIGNDKAALGVDYRGKISNTGAVTAQAAVNAWFAPTNTGMPTVIARS